MKDEGIVVLFSGGTDSTLTAALVQQEYRTVHLVTYDRVGFHATENTRVNAQMLRDRYGEDRFRHEIINIDRLFKWVSYERYFWNLRRHGFFLLSTCGLCKLAMHMRTIVYCLDNGVRHVSDGANQGMTMFPAQMRPVIEEVRKMYDRFEIRYSNPVFEFEAPEDGSFIEAANLQFLERFHERDSDPSEEQERQTPGFLLYKLGLAPAPNVKGSKYDRARQPRCFQLILFNIFALKYYMPKHTYEEYTERTVSLFKDKIARAVEVLDGYVHEGKHGKLFR
jgi:hypothetical protein